MKLVPSDRRPKQNIKTGFIGRDSTKLMELFPATFDHISAKTIQVLMAASISRNVFLSPHGRKIHTRPDANLNTGVKRYDPKLRRREAEKIQFG